MLVIYIPIFEDLNLPSCTRFSRVGAMFYYELRVTRFPYCQCRSLDIWKQTSNISHKKTLRKYLASGLYAANRLTTLNIIYHFITRTQKDKFSLTLMGYLHNIQWSIYGQDNKRVHESLLLGTSLMLYTCESLIMNNI